MPLENNVGFWKVFGSEVEAACLKFCQDLADAAAKAGNHGHALRTLGMEFAARI